LFFRSFALYLADQAYCKGYLIELDRQPPCGMKAPPGRPVDERLATIAFDLLGKSPLRPISGTLELSPA